MKLIRKSGVAAALLAIVWSIAFGESVAAFSTEQLTKIRDGFDARSSQLLADQISNTFPNKDCAIPTPVQTRCAWGKLAFALSALTLNRSAEEVREASREIESVVGLVPKTPGYRDLSSDDARIDTAYDFHFLTAALLYRTVRMFGPAGKMPARLAPGLSDKIDALFWDYVSNKCALSDARRDDPWRLWGSENHWAMRVETCWAGAELLRHDAAYLGRTYKDGSTASSQYAAWTSYLTVLIREKIRHGIFIEYFSPTYAAYSLGTFYTYFDFADDASELARMSKALLDVWWTAWAQEQINGVHGGSKTRTYWPLASAHDPVEGLPWLYLAIGKQTGANKRPSLLAMTLSRYRVPLVTMDIALDVKGRGTYEVWSRHLGLLSKGKADSWMQIDPQADAVLRYAFVTPSFIMGGALTDVLPRRQWAGISSQNRWSGLVLGGKADARIYATTYRPDKKAYNDVLVRQSGSTQLVRKLPPPWSQNAGPLRVWFGAKTNLVERNGWVFIADAAYVAVRPIAGSYRWDAGEPRWMIPTDPDPTVVIQAAEIDQAGSFTEFQNRVLAQNLVITRDVATVPTLEGRTIQFQIGSTSVAALQTIQAPEGSIASPFFNWDEKNGRLKIAKDGRELLLETGAR